MKYLITGGAGFIGGHLTEALLNQGHEVIAIDDLSTGSKKNLEAIKDHPKFQFIIGDILELPQFETLVYNSDMVFHLAAAVGVELVVHDPVRTIITNVHGTERVLKAASRYGTRVIVTSTSEVYGKSEKDEFSESDDLLIGSSTNSRWSYACSKLLDEFFFMAYFRDKKLPGTVVRLFNTVGPRQTGQYGMVMPRFVARALANEDIQVYGDGEQTRCFCHVADTVRALIGLSGSDAAIGEVVNIGSTRSISINELAEEIKNRLNSQSKIIHIPYEEAYEAGFEDMRRRMPSTEKINKLIGWQPEKSLEQIIDDVAKYLN
jgi:UDP-glucose 4-epimerase